LPTSELKRSQVGRTILSDRRKIRFYLALNSNTGAGTYLFDNLRFKP